MTRQLRPDGRERLEHRDPVVYFTCISTAKSSVRFRLGGTDLIASIYLDTATNSSFQINVEALPIVPDSYRLVSKIRLLVGSVLASIIQSEQKTGILCGSSKSLLVISLLVITDDGSALSSACNATILALMAAGVSLPYIPCATTIGIIRTADTKAMVIDPLKIEEKNLNGLLISVIDLITEEVLACVHLTAIHSTELRDALLLAHSCSIVLSRSMFGHIKPADITCTSSERPVDASSVEKEPSRKQSSHTATVKFAETSRYITVPDPFEVKASGSM